MTTYKNHVILSSVEDNGDINEFYPVVDAADIKIKKTNSGLSSTANNVKEVVDDLSSMAFTNISSFAYIKNSDENLSEINDEISSDKTTWSSEKISNYVDSEVSKFNPRDFNYNTEIANQISDTTCKTQQIYCVHSDEITSTPNNLTGNFIVEYFPFLDSSNDNSEVEIAVQRWTYLDLTDKNYIFMRIAKNGSWNPFVSLTSHNVG